MVNKKSNINKKNTKKNNNTSKKNTKKINNRKINKKANKKNKLGAIKKSAPSKKKEIDNNSLDNEIFIGVTRNEDINKNYPVVKKQKKSKPKKKKVKKLSPKQIKRRKIIFKIVRWTGLFAIMCGIIIYVMLSPLFAIKNITVNTDGKLTQQEIISLSAISLNENTFKFTKKQITENIKENSYVDKVDIKRKLPDEIQITINERVPKLMILYGNAYVYIDNQGYMLEISKEYQNLPILKGIKTTDEEIEAGKRLCNEDLQKLTTVLKIMETAKSEELLDLITEINIEDSEDYKIIMDAEEKTVYLGDCSALDERMLWVKAILQEEEGVAGEIFVNMNLNVDAPFFRERV